MFKDVFPIFYYVWRFLPSILVIFPKGIADAFFSTFLQLEIQQIKEATDRIYRDVHMSEYLPKITFR